MERCCKTFGVAGKLQQAGQTVVTVVLDMQQTTSYRVDKDIGLATGGAIGSRLARSDSSRSGIGGAPLVLRRCDAQGTVTLSRWALGPRGMGALPRPGEFLVNGAGEEGGRGWDPEESGMSWKPLTLLLLHFSTPHHSIASC